MQVDKGMPILHSRRQRVRWIKLLLGLVAQGCCLVGTLRLHRVWLQLFFRHFGARFSALSTQGLRTGLQSFAASRRAADPQPADQDTPRVWSGVLLTFAHLGFVEASNCQFQPT